MERKSGEDLLFAERGDRRLNREDSGLKQWLIAFAEAAEYNQYSEGERTAVSRDIILC